MTVHLKELQVDLITVTSGTLHTLYAFRTETAGGGTQTKLPQTGPFVLSTKLLVLSKPFSSNPISWTTFYERNRNDGGGVERLFGASLAVLSTITASHFKKPDKLVETIAGSTYSNMIMVTGDDDGNVHILHHGFVNATSFGGEASILFLSGNSSEAPLKSLAHASAVVPIKTGKTRGAVIDAPLFHDMLKVESETDFAKLRGNGNTILREKPNHMMIGPAVFLLAGGAQRIKATTLAYQIISRIRGPQGRPIH